MDTVITRLADWIATVEYDDIPERVREKARDQLASVVAALHAGMDTEAGRQVLEAVRRGTSPGPCTVLPTGDRLSLHDAVTAMSAMSMVLDYDDYLFMGHTGHSAVLGAWALCEAEGRTTRELLLAQVIANEVEGRLGASCVLGPQNGQAWSYIHALGAAALAARLLGLDATQTAHALAIALYQPSFCLWPGFMGPTSKVLTAAGPTLTGLQAASFAREGLTGALDIIEHESRGLWRHLAYVPLPGMMQGLGTAWVTDTLCYKPYPGCAYLDTTIDALLDVLAQAHQSQGRDLRAEDVARINVEASLLTVEMDNLSAAGAGDGPISPVAANFSITLSAALTVLAGRLTAAELQPAFLDEHRDTIRALAGRVTLTHDWTMTGEVIRSVNDVFGRHSPLSQLKPRDLGSLALGYRHDLKAPKKNPLGLGSFVKQQPGALLRAADWWLARRTRAGDPHGTAGDLGQVDLTRFKMTFPARVTLELTTGGAYTARQDVPRGGAGDAEIREAVARKIRTEVGAHLPAGQVERILERIADLEHTTLGDLTRSVCVGAGPRP